MKNKNLDKLYEMLKELVEPTEIEIMKLLDKQIEKAHKEEAKISIEKKADGSACSIIEGSKTAILISLAGLEKSILRKLEVPESVWKYIKVKTGEKEVNDCE